jgi:NADPH-dependent F420 reductase
VTIERVTVVGGTGQEGSGLALRWASAGIEVFLGSRSEERAVAAADEMKERIPNARISGLQNEAAVAASNVVAVVVPYAGQAAIYRSVAESIRPEAVVIDCTVPLAAAVGGRASQVLGVWEGSAAQQASALLPKGTTLCAAFHTLSAELLGDLDTPMEGDVLAVGAKAGKPVVKELVEAIPGLRFVDAGPLANARLVEPLTALMIGLNRRYKVHGAGIQIVGLPDDHDPSTDPTKPT